MGKLGHIAAKYESGRSGPGTISSGHGDPGGKSYGIFQMALKTGTLNRYIRESEYRRLFDKFTLGSKEFDIQWKRVAKKYPYDFEDDQLAFIHRHHYVPVRNYADSLGIPHTPAINEALFSIGVQHGKANTIVWRAKVKQGDSERVIIEKLYRERTKYVMNLTHLSLNLRNNIKKRYKSERMDVFGLIGVKRVDGVVKKNKKPVIVFILAVIGALVAAFFGA